MHHTASQAQMRVERSPKLKPYYDIICEYDWDAGGNGQEHIDWVCTAPISEILDWAQEIRANEKNN